MRYMFMVVEKGGVRSHIGTYDSLFYSIQLSLRKSGFDSTHDSQWHYKN